MGIGAGVALRMHERHAVPGPWPTPIDPTVDPLREPVNGCHPAICGSGLSLTAGLDLQLAMSWFDHRSFR
jgi:hypothetical protein